MSALELMSEFTRTVNVYQPYKEGHKLVEVKACYKLDADMSKCKTLHDELKTILVSIELPIQNNESVTTITDIDQFLNIADSRMWLARPVAKAYSNAVNGIEGAQPIEVGNSLASASG